MSLPFGLSAWYPLTVGPLADTRVLGEESPVDSVELQDAWDNCPEGHTLIWVDNIQGNLGQGLLKRCGRQSLGATLAKRWSTEGLIHRWRLMPNTGGSHVLMPMIAGGFEAGKALLPAGRRRWRMASSLLQTAVMLGLGDRLGFGELMVAVKGVSAPDPACAWIAARSDARIAISLGVPGYLRKATLRVCEASGRVAGFLKVAMGPGANARVEHETDTLKCIEARAFHYSTSPRLLDEGRWEGHAWFVQSALEGTRSGNEINAAHVTYLSQLARSTSLPVPGNELDVLDQARADLQTVESKSDAIWQMTMCSLLASLTDYWGEREIPCGLSHGDFTPWNLVDKDDTIVAFDWEFAQWHAPALSDLVHFHLQTGILVRRAAASSLLFELEQLTGGTAAALLSQRGLQPQDALALIGLEVLRAATADEALNQQERPVFEQVKWLRETRAELARLIHSRLAEAVPRLGPEVWAA
jgi:hypothetical protein